MGNRPIEDCGQIEALPQPLLLEVIRLATAAGILITMLLASPAFSRGW